MNIAPNLRFATAALMATVMVATSLPLGTVKAEMISTKQIIEPATTPDHRGFDASDSSAESARERIEAILAKTEVRGQMVALGVDPDEADARIASMTEQELVMIAGQLDQLPAGAGLGEILIIVFIVFGIAVLVDALGVLDIFPFVCSGSECGGQQVTYYKQSAYPEPAAGPVADPYVYQEQRQPAYRRQYDRSDPYAQRQAPRQETEQYYQPAPASPSRNYYEERFGTQRQIR
ncbi:MAG: PA2779 family protein [Geminicoccaceae bacterium]